jgi:DNA invertase Pin-like site-specific DNA recombinase
MRLVAYVRVSTDRQAADGAGVEVQERAIGRWARDNGHEIALRTRDEGASGSGGVDARAGLHDALAAPKRGVAAGLIIYRLDRLARRLTVQEATLATVWGLDGAVFAVDIGEVPRDDPDDQMKTALRQMIGVFAQLERGMIAARLHAGRLVKAERGEYAGFGSPHFGVEAVGGVLVTNENELVAIARAVELRRAGASLRAICVALANEGPRPKRAERWHPETLRKVLRRADEQCSC